MVCRHYGISIRGAEHTLIAQTSGIRREKATVLVHIIADYGMGDLAFAEVVQRIKLHLPDMEPVLTPVPAFSTIAAGF
jgi:hypothetical protein